MRQLTEPEIDDFIALGKSHPYVLAFLQEWYMDELTKLPAALDNVALKQGRCQVIKEVLRYAEPPKRS